MRDHTFQRLARLRDEAIRARASDGVTVAVGGHPRFVGQVASGGAIPSSTKKVFLVHPVTLDGPEREGGIASFSADTTRTIPVVMIGSRVPAAGDLVMALSIGGRWVANSGASSLLSCSPCSLPRKNLVVSWTNSQLGNGSTPLVFNAPSNWTSACTQQLRFYLACSASLIQFGVKFFLNGSCLGEPSQTCASPGLNPQALVLDSWSCSPLYLHYRATAAACTALSNRGYTAFTITA
ncbi:hypothetical protein [Aquisphaera insulae]|uniref:hypothetical protein n=1 Tax=Aquisphaera insulae TaxID=2712864 RepID=UPI0013ED3D20|nr:hypothetical protein [Aquisphaera insulae]